MFKDIFKFVTKELTLQGLITSFESKFAINSAKDYY